MAIICPSLRPLPSERVSFAELKVLAELERLPDEWIVLHSLWLKSHAVKLHAEADFVVLTDCAALIVEVKGGEVWRTSDGEWKFRKQDGSGEDTKREGPLDQAKGAYYAIRDHLYKLRRGDLFDEIAWGYCAIFPDCALQIDPRDAGYDPDVVLNNTRFPAGIPHFFTQLGKYWMDRCEGRSHHPHRRHGTVKDRLSLHLRREVASYLRPVLERVMGVGTSVASSEQELIQLTDKQILALDFASAEERNLLIGSAGTGKTVLAVEQARRMHFAGKRVLFVCFNSLLAARISSDLEGKGAQAVVVENYHQLATRLARQSGHEVGYMEDWGSFERALDSALIALVAEIGPDQQFDYLVVDEGQDLMSSRFMDLLDCLLVGGLENGRWLIALDTQQTIFRSQFDHWKYEEIRRLGRRTTLERNCRNTKPIAAHVRALSGIGSVSTEGAAGEWPAVRYYSDQAGYLRLLKKVVNEVIDGFVRVGLPASDIVLLTASKAFLPPEVMRPGFFLRPCREVTSAGAQPADAVTWATVQQFKGLEARAVILCGIESFADPSSRELFYVGASRARAALRILLPASCEEYRRAAAEIASLANQLVDSGSEAAVDT